MKKITADIGRYVKAGATENSGAPLNHISHICVLFEGWLGQRSAGSVKRWGDGEVICTEYRRANLSVVSPTEIRPGSLGSDLL